MKSPPDEKSSWWKVLVMKSPRDEKSYRTWADFDAFLNFKREKWPFALEIYVILKAYFQDLSLPFR